MHDEGRIVVEVMIEGQTEEGGLVSVIVIVIVIVIVMEMHDEGTIIVEVMIEGQEEGIIVFVIGGENCCPAAGGTIASTIGLLHRFGRARLPATTPLPATTV